MAITKQAVRDYVETKFKLRRDETQKAIEDAITARLSPILDQKFNSPEFARLERISQQFVDAMSEMTAKINHLKDNCSWEINRGIKAAEDYGVGLKDLMKTKIIQKVKIHVYNPLHEAITEKSFDGESALQTAALELGTVLAPEVKKLADLKTLLGELFRAIDIEPNGKRAYKAIAALGLDVSDFEEEQKRKGNLPAVIKLSVDVCLVNGTC